MYVQINIFLVIFIIFVLFLILNKLIYFRCKSKSCLIGKTAIITGGTIGMGYEIALDFASRGCRVILADIQNTKEAVEKIQEITGNQKILGKRINLSSFKSVRAFAADILSTESKLDILICNAGVGAYRISCPTEDGLENTMQINYFSHFLLVHLLLDLLKKSAPSRIVFTSSQAAYFSLLRVKNLNPSIEYFQKWYYKFNGGIYSDSKRACAAAAKSFGKKLKNTGVIVNAVHPGIVKTRFIPLTVTTEKNFFLGIPYLIIVFHTIGKTPEQGIQTLLHLAHSKEIKHVTGQSFMEGRVVPRPLFLTDNYCEEIWKATIKYCKLAPEEIRC